jgi:hypothetical protein
MDGAKLRKILLGESRTARAGHGERPRAGGTRLRGAFWARAMSVSLVFMVLVGFAGGARSLAGPTLSTPIAVTTAPAAPTMDLGVAGFAELFVSTWLSLTRDTTPALAAFYSGPVETTAAAGLTVKATTVVDEKPMGPGYWAVTVAAVIADQDQAPGRRITGGIRYYAVGVARAGGALTATGLPAQVPAPATAPAPRPAVAGLATPGPDERPVTDALTGFFQALLAGRGELDRYMAPGGRIVPIRPAPFADVAVRGLGIVPGNGPASRLVRVEVAATGAAKDTQVLHYSLTITQRANRWEIAELLGAPPLARDR